MATVRMTGLISGMDTESIIKGMVDAQRLKNKKVSDKLELSNMKEDKWKELNTKLYKLYKDDLSKLRLQSSYLTKKVSSTNEDLVTVTGSTTAPDGAHTLTIDQLASSQYVTGGKLGLDINNNAITTSTTLKDLGMDVNSTVIKLTNGEKEKTLVLSDTTTLKDFITACNDVGLNANYDTSQKRLFISAKESGEDNTFSITTGTISPDGTTALATINSLVGSTGLTTTQKSEVTNALKVLENTEETELNDLYTIALNGGTDADAERQEKIDAINTLIDYTILQSQKEAVAQVKVNIKDDLINGIAGATETDQKNTVVYNDLLARIAEEDNGLITDQDVIDKADLAYATYTQADKDTIFNQLVEKEYASTDTILDGEGNPITKAEQYQLDVEGLTAAYSATKLNDVGGELVTALSTYVGSMADHVGATSELEALGLGEITSSGIVAADDTKMTIIAAADSIITLDGAQLTGSSNTIVANGLTINLKGKTAVGETISINVSNNTEANYEMIKNFITSYNEILKEMNTLYYAGSSRGYDPLSDDEKEAMTESQIEKWETKITDSILRRDTQLGSIMSSMKTSINSSVTVDGKTYSLSNYGIQTSSDYSEKGLLHIFGDEDDSTYSDKTDKLMKALTEDPETTMKVFSEIAKNLYDTMADKMKAIPNVSSALTFYNDKLLNNEQTAYQKRVKVLEDKLVEMENRYYKQFSAMETALAKLQSQSSALAGMLGTSTNQ